MNWVHENLTSKKDIDFRLLFPIDGRRRVNISKVSQQKHETQCFRQRGKRTKKLSKESLSRSTRMTTDWDFFSCPNLRRALLRRHRMLTEALEICYVCWTLPPNSSIRPSPKVDVHSIFPSPSSD